MALSSSVQISTKVAGRELLTSGVVHFEGEHQVAVTIDDLKFVFEFKRDDGNPRYVGRLEGDVLYFELYNHKNSLGEGLLAPLDIAQLNSRALSFTYFTNTVNAEMNSRRFEYAFYLDEVK
ncbi:MAG: hypothetical protein NTV43_08295 [Methylococcales bacterium]|nr:hypothetical protein [Methylococcales bacterium]